MVSGNGIVFMPQVDALGRNLGVSEAVTCVSSSQSAGRKGVNEQCLDAIKGTKQVDENHQKLLGLTAIPNKSKPHRKGNSSMVPRKFLTVKEVSEYIGIATDTIYTMVSQKRIPFAKVGRLLRFDQTELDGWIEKHTVMPINT